MENRTPKNRYNRGAAPDPGKSAGKLDALKLLETAMDKRAGDIAQTATDMLRARLPFIRLRSRIPLRSLRAQHKASVPIRKVADWQGCVPAFRPLIIYHLGGPEN